jgi:hypothetical protein
VLVPVLGIALAVGEVVVLRRDGTGDGGETGGGAWDGGADTVPAEDGVGFGAGAFEGRPGTLGAIVGAAPEGLLAFPPLSLPLIANAPTTITMAQPAPISRVDQAPVRSLMG